jgi:radical SAM superfamily enzyme YgiQ (UPF0313 family)
MNILFFRPAPPDETIGLQHVMIVEPLELEILATLAEQNHKVWIIDLILENQPATYFIQKLNPDIVCITGYITHIKQMLNICLEVKRYNHNAVTIVGGVYIEKVPETIDNENVDYRVVRNAVQSFPQLIGFLAGTDNFPMGVLKKNETLNVSLLPAYNFSVPIPNRQLTKKYRPEYFYVFHNKVALLKTSFGCPYPCSFCFCRKIAGDNYSERPLENVIQELKSIKEKEVYIIDDNFLVSAKRVKEFIDLLKEHKIRKNYLIYGRADFIASHPELMRELKQQGLRTIIVGFESFNDAELNSLNKSTLAVTNEKAMDILNKYGIDCYASVIAMPNWDKADFDRATKKMIDLKIRFLNIQPLTPLEKTDIVFDDRDLIIGRDDYAKWDLAHVVVKPQKLSLQEYYNEILRMYIRVLFRPTNLIHHLKYPISMQFKLLMGAYKVKKQYEKKISDCT